MAYTYYNRLRRPGTMEELKLRVWRAVVVAEDTLARARETPDDVERVTRALNTAINVYREYRALLMDGEIEERLAALEEQADRHMQTIAARN